MKGPATKTKLSAECSSERKGMGASAEEDSAMEEVLTSSYWEFSVGSCSVKGRLKANV